MNGRDISALRATAASTPADQAVGMLLDLIESSLPEHNADRVIRLRIGRLIRDLSWPVIIENVSGYGYRLRVTERGWRGPF